MQGLVSGQRVEHSTFSKRIDVECDCPAFPRYRSAHRCERVVIIEIPERRDMPTDELILGRGLPPLRDLIAHSDIDVRRERFRVLPVVGVINGANTAMRWVLGHDSVEGCE